MRIFPDHWAGAEAEFEVIPPPAPDEFCDACGEGFAPPRERGAVFPAAGCLLHYHRDCLLAMLTKMP
jgi:hypothetical protein